MADREKVIEGLEYLITAYAFHGDDAECLGDALQLLKEHTPVNPRFIDGKRNHFVKCGNCNFDLMHGMKFCPHCGRAVKWE